MTRTIIILTMLAVFGCENDEYPKFYQHRERWCSGKEDSARLVDCMERITKAGNPMSDEEGEDLVSMAHGVCQQAVCPERWLTCKNPCRGCNHHCWLP